ncbi:MAG: peptidylprolyl isomerase [Thiothrix sp.]|nr:peptidylprolyl isomerase [Thiothrix sp.]HPE59988.1 peptidylprolyl isomerase [Thiolinea sp.]
MEIGVYTPPAEPAAAQAAIPPVPSDGHDSAIRVGSVVIPEEAIAQELQYHPAETMEAAWQAAATSLVIRELLAQRAASLGVQAGSEEERTALLLERELPVAEPGEAQCRHYFSNNRQRFQTPALLAVSHILLPAAADDLPQRDAQRELARSLLAQLQDTPDSFAALARQHSACPSAGQGGSLGQLSKGQTVAEFEQVVWSLPAGLCDFPVETRFGFHLVRVDQRVEGKPLDYPQVSGHIRRYLHEQATRTALNHYLQRLSADIGVEGMVLAAAD